MQAVRKAAATRASDPPSFPFHVVCGLLYTLLYLPALYTIRAAPQLSLKAFGPAQLLLGVSYLALALEVQCTRKHVCNSLSSYIRHLHVVRQPCVIVNSVRVVTVAVIWLSTHKDPRFVFAAYPGGPNFTRCKIHFCIGRTHLYHTVQTNLKPHISHKCTYNATNTHIQALADDQKSRYKIANPGSLLTGQLYRYSRHFNFFCEVHSTHIRSCLLPGVFDFGIAYLSCVSHF